MTVRVATLVCIVNEKAEVLFGLKTRKVGQGKRMWPGGKKDPCHPSLVACAISEVESEVHLTVAAEDLVHRGVIEVTWEHQPDVRWQVHVFIALAFSGIPQATDELADPQWYGAGKIPWREMFESDRLWMPNVFIGQEVWMRFSYRPDGTVARYESLRPFPIPR